MRISSSNAISVVRGDNPRFRDEYSDQIATKPPRRRSCDSAMGTCRYSIHGESDAASGLSIRWRITAKELLAAISSHASRSREPRENSPASWEQITAASV